MAGNEAVNETVGVSGTNEAQGIFEGFFNFDPNSVASNKPESKAHGYETLKMVCQKCARESNLALCSCRLDYIEGVPMLVAICIHCRAEHIALSKFPAEEVAEIGGSC